MYVLAFVPLFSETSGVADSNNDSDPERGGRVHCSTIVYQHTSNDCISGLIRMFT